ncbi:MAG TPA: hypothetical protein VIX14_03925 [Terriglobales bacterium]
MLILGESGTGKERVAKSISGRLLAAEARLRREKHFLHSLFRQNTNASSCIAPSDAGFSK